MIDNSDTYSRKANQTAQPEQGAFSGSPPSPHPLEELARLKEKLRLIDQDRVARGKMLRRIRETMVNIDTDDEGDRVYFASSNGADDFDRLKHAIDAWGWDEIMREGKLPDLVSDCQKANARANKAEAALAALGWRTMETLPTEGFFLAWSPDWPDIPAVFRADIFASMRAPGTPKHLTANHFTHWMPCPAAPALSKEAPHV